MGMQKVNQGKKRRGIINVPLLTLLSSCLFTALTVINSSELSPIHREPNDENPAPLQRQGIVFSSYLRFQQDPRIKEELPKPDFQTIYHLWTSVMHYRLHAVIFYDDFSFDQDFINRYSYPPYIRFQKVDPPTKSWNPNDFRFILYRDYLKKDGNQYDWYLFVDRDVLFNRNPFLVLQDIHQRYGHEFIGSYDGGNWRQGGAQSTQYPECFSTRPEGLPLTPNGNCGLWAATYRYAHCILDCMTETFLQPPVAGKGTKTPCDMAVHDHCVFYGGCFPNTTKGVYAGDLILQKGSGDKDDPASTVRWGKETQSIEYGSGKKTLFGPTIEDTEGRRMCLRKNWTVSHLRCGKKQRGSICFDHSSLSFRIQDVIAIKNSDKNKFAIGDLDEEPKSIERFLQRNLPFTSDCRLNFTSGLPLRPQVGKLFIGY